jgi:hypothetical protein
LIGTGGEFEATERTIKEQWHVAVGANLLVFIDAFAA